MATLSVVLIVRNEADNLAACLDTVSWADEIVIMDSGSDDATLDIARRYTDKVYVDTDWQGFGIQRQRAQARASGEWLLMLDADERVTPELRSSIEAAVAHDRRDLVYAVPRLSWVFGRFIRHSGWYPDYVSRLYARTRTGYRADRVHEKLMVGEGMQLSMLTGDLLHYTYRDMNHYLVKSAHYAAAWAQQRQEQGKRASLLQGLLHGVGCFLKMYLLRAGFLDGRQGLLLALLSAHSTFVKYADLWVRTLPSGNTER
ncbi:MAG: glycosyltransferase family 2 protein [Pseudomonadota bacterium]|nr:glycosyltransferase family 2 protein [Pseudomonadota bacterium]